MQSRLRIENMKYKGATCSTIMRLVRENTQQSGTCSISNMLGKRKNHFLSVARLKAAFILNLRLVIVISEVGRSVGTVRIN